MTCLFHIVRVKQFRSEFTKFSQDIAKSVVCHNGFEIQRVLKRVMIVYSIFTLQSITQKYYNLGPSNTGANQIIL